LNQIKKLAGQTAIYGVSSILGRLLNYLLVPLHTRAMLPDKYGVIGELYAYIATLLVVLLYGMETAFFRYSQSSKDKNKVFSTALISIIFTTSIFLVLALSFSGHIADMMRYPDNQEYIIYFVLIVAMDALSSIPYAKLRAENKAVRFAIIKLINILTNIGLNLYFYFDFESWQIKSEMGVEYVFIANLIASGVTLLLLSPQFLNIKTKFSYPLWRKMMFYALPLLFSGLAGIVNETFDRILLKYLLPENIAMSQVGIYSACYKVSILMTIFIQAFRYAAEPFFFAQEKEKDSKEVYAKVMTYFVIVGLYIFLGIMLFIDIVILFIDTPYREGQAVIPILLTANLFLGIFYNLSVWYKLTNKTKYGAALAIMGALLTFIFNIIWIPIIGYMGSAWATLICYASMTVASYFLGKKHYPISYNLKRISIYILIAYAIYGINSFIDFNANWVQYFAAICFLLIFTFVIYLIEVKKIAR
jgi:O-antigen/teichoic acid export membrane protein